MAAIPWDRSYRLAMRGLYSAFYSNEERWVKLTFTYRQDYREKYGMIWELLTPSKDSPNYSYVMAFDANADERSIIIKARPLPPDNVYQVNSAVEIIHFLGKMFDREKGRSIPVLPLPPFPPPRIYVPPPSVAIPLYSSTPLPAVAEAQV